MSNMFTSDIFILKMKMIRIPKYEGFVTNNISISAERCLSDVTSKAFNFKMPTYTVDKITYHRSCVCMHDTELSISTPKITNSG